MSDTRDFIAKNVAALLHDGDVVNLGVGIPTLVTHYLPEGVHLLIQAENGMLGCGPGAEPGQEDPDIIDAGAKYILCKPGACFFDSAVSFGIIRGGHLDATILGALQVDAKGNLANWTIPGKLMPGPGGAMDLVAGAKKVIVAMEHCTKDGSPKVLEECTLPLTALGVVSVIVTDLAILEKVPEGLQLAALAPGVSLEELQAKTACPILVPDPENIPVMQSV